MKIDANAKWLCIFINSTDQSHWQNLASAIVQLCKRKGIAGVTVTRGVEGYGASQQLHSEQQEALMIDMPVRIDIVDLPERIEPLLAELDGMIGEGLIAISDVRIRRYLTDPK